MRRCHFLTLEDWSTACGINGEELIAEAAVDLVTCGRCLSSKAWNKAKEELDNPRDEAYERADLKYRERTGSHL